LHITYQAFGNNNTATVWSGNTACALKKQPVRKPKEIPTSSCHEEHKPLKDNKQMAILRSFEGLSINWL